MGVTGILMQTYFSIQHIQAAAIYTRLAVDVEAQLEYVTDSRDLDVEVKAHTASALFMSVAFIEALANELYADSLKTDGGHLKSISKDGLTLIAELAADKSFDKTKVLSKYKQLLEADEKKAIGKGDLLGQNVLDMIELRNNLVHYNAYWLDTGTPGMVRSGNLRDSNLQSRMKGKFENRVGSSPISGDAWLGSGCAKWCLESTIAFTDEFFKRIGIEPLYGHVREKLIL